ncbi:MAG: YciI family protein [Planctomycetales bacterium]|nr:YciI family protein [Planctomycetales bacterium]
MKFICLGYLNEATWNGKSDDERKRFMNECFEYHNELQQAGHVVGGEALDSSRNTVTLRLRDGSVDVSDGPYVETKEVLAGFNVLEARDLNHAIALMSKHPGLKAGPFEIRAADREVSRMFKEHQAAIGTPSLAMAVRRVNVVGAKTNGA